MPTATTPAMSDNGRPAPKSARGTMACGLLRPRSRSSSMTFSRLHGRGQPDPTSSAQQWVALGGGSKAAHHPHHGHVSCQGRGLGPASWFLGPPPKPRHTPPLFILNEETHWRASWLLHDQHATPPSLEPALEALLAVRCKWRHDLTSIRENVIREIQNMVTSGRTGRRHGWHNARHQSGPGWRDRNDGRYQNPVSLQRLRKDNFEYVRARTSVGRVAPHSDVMLAELIEEARLGRVIGPAKAPSWCRSRPARSPTSRTWTIWWSTPPKTTLPLRPSPFSRRTRTARSKSEEEKTGGAQRTAPWTYRPTTWWGTSQLWPEGWRTPRTTSTSSGTTS